MSTKVYDAFRMKSGQWPDFCRLLYDHHLHQAAKTVRTQLGSQKKFFEGLSDLIKTALSPIRELGLVELECELKVRLVPSRNFVVALPFSDLSLHGFRPCRWTYPEYGYWNNTDMPDHVTRREWNRRRRFWDEKLNDWDWYPSKLVFSATRHEDIARLFEAAYPRASKRVIYSVQREAGAILRELHRR